MKKMPLFIYIFTLSFMSYNSAMAMPPPPGTGTMPSHATPTMLTKISIGMPFARVQAILGPMSPCARQTSQCFEYVEMQSIPGRPPIARHHQLYFQQGRLARMEAQPSHPAPPTITIGMTMAQVELLLGAPHTKQATRWEYIQHIRIAHNPPIESRRVLHFAQGRLQRMEEYQLPPRRS